MVLLFIILIQNIHVSIVQKSVDESIIWGGFAALKIYFVMQTSVRQANTVGWLGRAESSKGFSHRKSTVQQQKMYVSIHLPGFHQQLFRGLHHCLVFHILFLYFSCERIILNDHLVFNNVNFHLILFKVKNFTQQCSLLIIYHSLCHFLMDNSKCFHC